MREAGGVWVSIMREKGGGAECLRKIKKPPQKKTPVRNTVSDLTEGVVRTTDSTEKS